MSLNRSEQLLHDYIQQHREERQFWQNKVRSIVTGANDGPSAVARLDLELWRYLEERSSVVPVLVAAARSYGAKRISMKNLAEYWVRLWTEPRPKKPSSESLAGP